MQSTEKLLDSQSKEEVTKENNVEKWNEESLEQADCFAFSTMMMPWCVTIILKYSMIQKYGWMDSYTALIVPMAKNGISSIAIFQFLWSWEDFFWPYLVINQFIAGIAASAVKE